MAGRRTNGEGSVYRRDGGWEAAITVAGKRRTARAGTRAAATVKLRKLQREQDEGLPVVNRRLTVASFLEEWLGVVATMVRPKTHKRYAEYVRVHAVPVIGGRRLVEIGASDLQRLYGLCLARGSSPSTVQHLHTVLHRAFRMAEEWGYVQRSPSRFARPPRVPRFDLEPLSVDEVQRLLVTAQGMRFEALIVLAVLTGMRQGELLALRWADVILDGEAVVTVRGSLQRTREGLCVMEPKTRDSMRAVAIGQVAAEALRRHRARQAQERLLLGDEWANFDLVFPNHFGRFQEAGAFVARDFRPLLARAGLRRVRFHDLRHTFATLQLVSGQPVKIVSAMLGHSRTSITQDLYTHVSAAMQRDAASALERLVVQGVAGGVAGGDASEASSA